MRSFAIRVPELGGPEVLQLDEIEVPDPPAGHVQIKHTAIGVNFIDTYHRTGLYPLPSLPHGIGMEGAGLVSAVGDGVVDIALGDRVAYASGPPGSYCEVRNLVADRVVPLPDDITDESAAAVLLQGMTVEYLVRRTFVVKPGMTVLLHAAAGGVGLIACQWLSHLGVRVIGTVGSDEKAERARAHGCAHAIVYTRNDFVTEVKALTDGAGVPVVYDSVGRATFEGSLACLAPRGMLVGFGNASGKPDPFDPLLLARGGSLYMTRPTLFDYVRTRAELLESSQALFEVLRAGAVKPVVGGRWALAEAAKCHRALESRATVGSLVLIP